MKTSEIKRQVWRQTTGRKTYASNIIGIVAIVVSYVFFPSTVIPVIGILYAVNKITERSAQLRQERKQRDIAHT